jgi:hypothetical protein
MCVVGRCFTAAPFRFYFRFLVLKKYVSPPNILYILYKYHGISLSVLFFSFIFYFQQFVSLSPRFYLLLLAVFVFCLFRLLQSPLFLTKSLTLVVMSFNVQSLTIRACFHHLPFFILSVLHVQIESYTLLFETLFLVMATAL